jgi:hypothetical protein
MMKNFKPQILSLSLILAGCSFPAYAQLLFSQYVDGTKIRKDWKFIIQIRRRSTWQNIRSSNTQMADQCKFDGEFDRSIGGKGALFGRAFCFKRSSRRCGATAGELSFQW